MESVVFHPAPRGAPSGHRAVVTASLIGLQVGIWLAVLFFAREGQWVHYALVPRSFSIPRLLISPFLHVHPVHLGLNLLALWLFGSALERAIGPGRFLAIYLGAGWFAGIMHWAVTTASQMDLDLDLTQAAVGAIGSSGGVAGVLGAYCVRLPHRPLRLPFARRWRIAPVVLLGAWLAWEFGQAMLSTARGTGAGVGHWAHFAGFIFGLMTAYLLRLPAAARMEQLQVAAREAMAGEEFAAAARAWRALLAEAPDHSAARWGLVQACLAAGDLPGAAAAASEGLERAVRAGERRRAVAMYRCYLEVLPDLHLPAGIRYRIGCWLAELEDDQRAFAALLAAAREDAATPAAAAALFRAGEIAADRLEDPRRARMAWQKLLLDYHDSAYRDRAYERLGRLSGGGER